MRTLEGFWPEIGTANMFTSMRTQHNLARVLHSSSVPTPRTTLPALVRTFFFVKRRQTRIEGVRMGPTKITTRILVVENDKEHRLRFGGLYQLACSTRREFAWRYFLRIMTYAKLLFSAHITHSQYRKIVV